MVSDGFESTTTRSQALAELINHARELSKLRESKGPHWPGMVLVPGGNRGLPLPAYAPYVGESYFAPRNQGKRVFVLALSQNLTGAERWSRAWLDDWVNGSGLIALNRQNNEFQKTKQASMNPFDTGHLAIIAALVRALADGFPPSDDALIHDHVAATNLSKWSFRSPDGKRTADNDACLGWCWDQITSYELASLEPDYLICAGNNVAAIAQRLGGPRTFKLLKVAFPNRRVINTRYRGPLLQGQPTMKSLLPLLSDSDRAFRLYTGATLEDCLRTDFTYFAEMYVSLKAQLP